MGNIIKLNTVFSNPVDGNPFSEVPSIAAINEAIYTVGNNAGDLVGTNGFIRLNNMKETSLKTKGEYYIHGYGVYTGTGSETPSHSIFVEYVTLAGDPVTNREMIASAPDGKFLVPLILKVPQTAVASGITIADIIESY